MKGKILAFDKYCLIKMEPLKYNSLRGKNILVQFCGETQFIPYVIPSDMVIQFIHCSWDDHKTEIETG